MARKCSMCKGPITGVRRDKKTCSDSCRVNLSRLTRLIVAKQQGGSVTNGTRQEVDSHCFEHGMDKQYCKLMKHAK